MDRRDYEQRIEQSPLFELKENTDAYRRERYKLFENLYNYLLAGASDREKSVIESHGEEILKVWEWCLAHYRPESGAFLPFFLAVWNKQSLRLQAMDLVDGRLQGMVGKKTQKAVGRYHMLAGKIKPDCPEQEKYARVAEAMGISVSAVKRLAVLEKTCVLSETSGGDGEEEGSSLFDQIAGGVMPAEVLEEKASIREVLDALEAAFDQLQNRQKDIVSELITAKLCAFLPFGSADHYEMISAAVTEQWARTGKAPTQKEIAAKHGRGEESISRTMKNYLRKAREMLRDREREQ